MTKTKSIRTHKIRAGLYETVTKLASDGSTVEWSIRHANDEIVSDAWLIQGFRAEDGFCVVDQTDGLYCTKRDAVKAIAALTDSLVRHPFYGYVAEVN